MPPKRTNIKTKNDTITDNNNDVDNETNDTTNIKSAKKD